ncbi:short-chain fatty acids transporter [Dethiosulfatibacter aminovorans DSM 17477]|uniref:Short-chain fatty acids transporter n=1 Tax=Dethiosulfatibacter aminovorans DSM 17477 TaxID=1121476 RepID=A0A1M6C5D9_9FIRM|nr:TIGR00366 family protein [Dethiosulfatibacter aminovorans]SHI55948.1 short-chain fatty acids transporter [Dethiosulfatibacter aminovorans DSM 17477]
MGPSKLKSKKKRSNFLAKAFSRYLPDSYSIAILLAIIVFLSGVIFTESTIMDMVGYFGNGIPSLFNFGMQMALILITGHSLASSKSVKNMLISLSGIPKTATQGIVFTAVACMFLNYMNWGLGMIGGALLAKQVATKNRKIHYPLLIALVYGATIIRGFSTSIPLIVATPGHFLEESIGVVPIGQTLFSYWNIVISIGLIILLALSGKIMMPPEDEVISIPEHLTEVETTEDPVDSNTFAEKFSHSKILSFSLSAVLLVYCVNYFMNVGTLNISIDIVIILFMAMGIILHGNLMNYKTAVKNAVNVTSGIMIQFPIYAGIMAMMKTSGLAAMMSQWFVSVSTQDSFPLTSLLSASIVNIFVPSGGGQWAIQAPIMMPAAADLGVDTAKTIMAIAWGDALTNQIQPFWALPILGVAGLGIKDIMGYCATWCLVAGLFIAGVLFIL